MVDEEENLLEVIVPDDQLTNAIGRKGQNVKLAARLLGWKVDIFTETRYNEANAIGHGLEQVASVAEVPPAGSPAPSMPPCWPAAAPSAPVRPASPRRHWTRRSCARSGA